MYDEDTVKIIRPEGLLPVRISYTVVSATLRMKSLLPVTTDGRQAWGGAMPTILKYGGEGVSLHTLALIAPSLSAQSK